MTDLLTYSKGGEAAFGWVQSQNAVLETMQAGASLSATTSGTFFRVGMSGSHFGYQAFFAIDFSGLPADAVIRGGYFYLSGANDGSTTSDFIMQVRRFDWGPTVTTADWRNATQAAACPLIAALDSSAYSGNAMLFPISDPSGLTPGQVNGFIIVSDRFISGTHPVNSGEYVNFDDPGVSGGEVGCTLFYEIADPVDPWVEVPLDMTDEGLSTPSGVTTLASWQPFAFDPDKYAGEDVSYYFEAVIEAMHGTLIQTWNVKNLADNSVCASVSLSPLLGSGLYRVPFTPAAGHNVYAIEIPTGPSAGSNIVSQARIVVRVVKPTKLRLQVPLVTEKRDLNYYQTTQLGVGAGTPWKVLSEPAPALWRKDSAAWADLAGETPWTFEAVLATAGTRATLYNVTDGTAVASSELTCASASPTLYSASFADAAAGFHDGDDFDVRVSSTTYVYAARLFVDLQAPKDFELLYRYGRSRAASAALQTSLDRLGRVRPRWAGILSAADTVALYNELSGYCADDAEVAFLADVGTSRLVRTDPSYSERAGVNFNSATKARRRVTLTGLDDGDCALMTIHGSTANSLVNHALLVVKVNGFKLGPEWTGLAVQINGGAASTDDNDVTLTLAAQADGQAPDQMCFSDDGVTYGDWESYATSRAYQLPSQTDEDEHVCTVYAKFRVTEDGTDYDSDAVNDSITLQIDWTELAVDIESVSLNDGIPIAGATVVPMSFGGFSSAGEVVSYCYSVDGGAASAWADYVPNLSLPGHPMRITVDLLTTGEHYVGVYLKDDDDNTLLIGTDDIVLFGKEDIDYDRPQGVIPVRMYADSSQVTRHGYDSDSPGVIPVRIVTSARRRR